MMISHLTPEQLKKWSYQTTRPYVMAKPSPWRRRRKEHS